MNVDDAYLDRAGYYALARLDQRTHQPLERQLNFYGGLKWRYEEFVPYERRRIDRVASFRTAKALKRNPTSSKQIGDFVGLIRCAFPGPTNNF